MARLPTSVPGSLWRSARKPRMASKPGARSCLSRGYEQPETYRNGCDLDSYKFSVPQTVLDVGEGNGGFLSAILACNKHLSGILFDQTSDIPECVMRAGLTISIHITAARIS